MPSTYYLGIYVDCFDPSILTFARYFYLTQLLIEWAQHTKGNFDDLYDNMCKHFYCSRSYFANTIGPQLFHHISDFCFSFVSLKIFQASHFAPLLFLRLEGTIKESRGFKTTLFPELFLTKLSGIDPYENVINWRKGHVCYTATNIFLWY